MTKKTIKEALKANGVKGFSRACISLETGWVVVNGYCGKLDNNLLHLKPIDLADKTSRHYVILF